VQKGLYIVKASNVEGQITCSAKYCCKNICLRLRRPIICIWFRREM